MATLTANGANFYNGQNGFSPRYPTPPQSASIGNLCFPTDLVNNNRNFYITLQLANYNRFGVSAPASLIPEGSLTLPIPLKINETQTVEWDQVSLTTQGLGVLQKLGASIAPKLTKIIGGAISASDDALSVSSGIQVNPFLVMLFKTQNFKQHNLQWILAPNNSADQNSLQNIVNTFKNAMLPTSIGGGTGLGYPMIVIPYLSVGAYTYNFKPCAIDSLSVDWSAGATPAFFKDQSPALVSLTMQLKEIELWYQGDITNSSIL